MEDKYEMETDGNVTYHYKNGWLHREDGPAIEYKNGSKFWLTNGKYNREDGPACILFDGNKEWWINDIDITDEVEEWITSNNIPHWSLWTNKEKALFKLKFL